MIEMVLQAVDYLNGNKFFWGVTMLLLNFGSRFVIGDLGKVHEQILANEFVKKIITFSLFFVATRDIVIAFVLTILYIVIIDGILHEKRRFCMIPQKYIKTHTQISDEEYQRALSIIKEYEKSKEEKSDINFYDIYKQRIENL
jgi:type IV secretory pathway VirB3-like protein|uniref:Uncharacterized protein n=1 Tax=viral metagenome TaxID=1070528 RepID=A0A6C0BE16_9ZZZZ